jgi:hypothetical protein
MQVLLANLTRLTWPGLPQTNPTHTHTTHTEAGQSREQRKQSMPPAADEGPTKPKRVIKARRHFAGVIASPDRRQQQQQSQQQAAPTPSASSMEQQQPQPDGGAANGNGNGRAADSAAEAIALRVQEGWRLLNETCACV